MPTAQVESAQQVVVKEWQSRRLVVLDTSGNWHQCCRDTCSIKHLEAHVCVEGLHIVPGRMCTQHPCSAIVHVHNVYACQRTGAIHICDRSTCAMTGGRCNISGLSCIAQDSILLEAPRKTRRIRRRQNGVHTNEQGACILIYDLLYSMRRIRYEIRRAETTLDVARRHSQREIRRVQKTGSRLRLQCLTDIYADCRQRIKYVPHLTRAYTSEDKQAVCRYYASIFIKLWGILSAHLPCRCTFEGALVAVLYGMRRGVACDGMYAIPRDAFVGDALPDAHSVAEVGISRRLLTQSKNALFESIQKCIDQNIYRVEQFASIFSSEDRPAAVGRQ